MPKSCARFGRYRDSEGNLAYLRTSEQALSLAWNDVLRESGKLADVVHAAMAAAMEGTREYCIEEYVRCQEYARRGFSRRRCQPCMDKCMGNGYIWPVGGECDFD
jgi:hypothetical protein